jgi:nitric oxide reductase subunit B
MELVGGGAFGGMINAPIIEYYQHATFLTLNYAHTFMFGAFGLLGRAGKLAAASCANK